MLVEKVRDGGVEGVAIRLGGRLVGRRAHAVTTAFDGDELDENARLFQRRFKQHRLLMRHRAVFVTVDDQEWRGAGLRVHDGAALLPQLWLLLEWRAEEAKR